MSLLCLYKSGIIVAHKFMKGIVVLHLKYGLTPFFFEAFPFGFQIFLEGANFLETKLHTQISLSKILVILCKLKHFDFFLYFFK